MTDYFEIGTILKPQGIKGEVKVEPYTDDLTRLVELKEAYFKEADKYVAKQIESIRVDIKFAYIKFHGVTDRDEAEKLRGKAIYIDRENASELPEGAYYIADLIGMKVYNEKGIELGLLKDIMQTGSKDIYVVALKDGGTLSFPSVEGAILNRDIEIAEMMIDSRKIEEIGIYDI